MGESIRTAAFSSSRARCGEEACIEKIEEHTTPAARLGRTVNQKAASVGRGLPYSAALAL